MRREEICNLPRGYSARVYRIAVPSCFATQSLVVRGMVAGCIDGKALSAYKRLHLGSEFCGRPVFRMGHGPLSFDVTVTIRSLSAGRTAKRSRLRVEELESAT